jgi:hypothetical protein
MRLSAPGFALSPHNGNTSRRAAALKTKSLNILKIMDTKQDDGSLSFLRIEPDKNSRHFNCTETTQQKLINLSFWVCDYLEDVKTKFGNNRFLVKIKLDMSNGDSEEKKFFTNSQEIKYVLGKIRELNAFPRKVTMRASGTRYYFE